MLKRLLRSKQSLLSVYSLRGRNEVCILLTFRSTDEYLYDFLTGPTSSDIPETPFDGEGSLEGSPI